jgi:small subunit ribosomal protein S9
MANSALQQPQQWLGLGRRKSATARIYLRPGTGVITINGRDLKEYFPRLSGQTVVLQPLTLTGNTDKFDVVVNVQGGGITGQVGAVRLGITRALMEFDAATRPELKKAGYVTRDSREVERKKYGQPGARRRLQFSKR